MRRGLVVSLALLCACLGRAEKIDFDAPGQTLGVTIEQLGKQLGRPLYVSPNIRDEVVVVHVTDVEVTDLFAKLAEVANAEWKHTHTGDVLERSSSKERELKDASIAKRAKAVTDYLRQFEPELKREFTTDDAKQLRANILTATQTPDSRMVYSELQKESAHGPYARLAHRLLLAVDPKLLVDIPYGSRRVFALHPNALQFPIRDQAKAAFEQLVDEQNTWAAVAADTPVPENGNLGSNPLTKKSPLASVREDYVLEVKRGQMATSLFCNLYLPRLDRPQEPLYQVIAPSTLGETFSQVTGFTPDMPAGVSNIVRFAASSVLQIPDVPPLTDAEAKLLRSPKAYDLLGHFANEVLSRRYADADLVALLSDDGCLASLYLLSFKGELEQFERFLRDVSAVNVAKADGWVEIQPKDPYTASFARTDRSALDKLVSDTAKTSNATFTQFAQFNSSLNEPGVAYILYFRALGYGGWQDATRPDYWHVSRLYGALSQGQKFAMNEGGNVVYGNLPRDQRRLVEALVTSDLVSYRGKSSTGTPFEMWRAGDPTVMFEKGIPDDARISVTTRTETCLFGYMRVGQELRALNTVSAYSIAQGELAKSGRGIQFPNRPTLDAYAVGTRVAYSFEIKFSDDVWQSFDIKDDLVDPDAKPGPWTELPEQFVAEIRRLLSESGGG